MSGESKFRNDQSLIRPRWPRGLANLDLAHFPLVYDFEIVLDAWEWPIGPHLRFWSERLGQLASFPWWDNADLALRGMTAEDIPVGTINEPYADDEQGWEILIFRVGDYVYVMEGCEPTEEPAVWDAWFCVPLVLYIHEWMKQIKRFNPSAEYETPAQSVAGWQGPSCLACRKKMHRTELPQ